MRTEVAPTSRILPGETAARMEVVGMKFAEIER